MKTSLTKGQKVLIRGFRGEWTVVIPEDSDGEVGIQSKDESGWFYVNASDVIVCTNGLGNQSDTLVVSTPQGESSPFFVNSAETKTFTFENQSMENTDMNASAQATRRVAMVTLIDPDAGLKPELALVKKFGTVVYDGSVDNLKMKLVMDNDMAGILAKHNAKRGAEIDLAIRKATGQELKLQPVELSDLQWVIDEA